MVNNKILIVIPSMQQGGAERIVSILSNYWVKKEYHISIVCFDSMDSFYLLDRKITHCKLNSDGSNLGFISRLFNNFIRFNNYLKYARKAQPDIIISFTSNANIFCIIYNFFLRKPLIISERTNPKFSTLPKLINFLPAYIYKYADALVVQTFETLKIYEELKIKLPLKTKVIFNPIENKTFSVVNDVKRQNRILAVGRLDNKVKQFDRLIEMFNSIENTGWELYIVGNGTDFLDLQNQIRELNLQKKVFLLGSQHQLNTLYQSAKIFTLTSTHEGFPNALCEAMANGCACVSYDCPTGPSSIIENNINGVLVKLNDENSFCHQIRDLMMNENRRLKLSNEAYKITNRLNENIILKEWETLINDILQYGYSSM